MKNKKRLMTVLMGICLIVFGCILIPKDVEAHRTWKKITKLPNGKYTVDRSIEESRDWWIDGITLKISKKYFTLNCSVESLKSGRVYCSDPLKMKLDSKCKFYRYNFGYRKISKKKAQKLLKDANKYGYAYYSLPKFVVKNNKVIKVYLDEDLEL